MNSLKFSIVLFAALSFNNSPIYGFPQLYQPSSSNSLNSDSSVGSFGNAESNATAHGPGSSVGVSGVVTGDSTTSMGAQYIPSKGPSSGISSQANCSDFSTSNASGSNGAEAVSTGGCVSNVDNIGDHQLSNKQGSVNERVEIGMQSQVTGPAPAPQPEGVQIAGQGAQIAQASNQNGTDGSAEAYQLVWGDQANSQFSGIMAAAAANAEHAGSSEVLVTHQMGSTIIENILEPSKKSRKSEAGNR